MSNNSVFELSSLNGLNGFRLDGIDADDFTGESVASAGDVNGDGFDDIIIGAAGGDLNGNIDAGETYVVFGSDVGFPASLPLDNLDGTNGFRLDGIDAGDVSGYSVAAAGDVNGDSFDDIIIGAYLADPDGNVNAGETFVVFGSDAGFPASMSLDGLDGTDGFRLDGIDERDDSGFSVAAAGDVNGDGFDDIIIGALAADPNGNIDAGETYVVFGSNAGFPASLLLDGLDGTNGFRLGGIDERDFSGISVAAAGDVNGDGFDDVIIGALAADPNGNIDAGETYVVFGSNAGFPASLSLDDLDGTNGFRLDGIDPSDRSGSPVASAGDVNGDGLDDIIIGAKAAAPNGNPNAGETYVVFGSDAGFPASMSLGDLDGTNGFRLNGIDAYDNSGFSVAAAGDVNGDGFDDIIIGAGFADQIGNANAGESYVIFGGPTSFPAASPVLGTEGNDWLTLPDDWRVGLREIDGGAGIDMMSFAGLDSGIYANTETGQANSSFASAPFDLIMTGIENVTGTSFADIFNGSDRAEVFRGLGGRDTFYGSHAGADTYIGGTSVDTLTYIQSGEGVSASLFRGRGWSGDAAGDRISEIENLVGSNHDDFLWGDHGNNKLTGAHGDDVIVGAGGDDYILAGFGTDTIVFSGARAEYRIETQGIRTEVEHLNGGVDGFDIIGHAEVLRFADGDVLI